MKNDKIELRINKERLEELILKIMAMFKSKTCPFDSLELFPDAIVPDRIEQSSKKHAFYLFYACMLDSRQRAESVYSGVQYLSRQTNLTLLYRLSKQTLQDLIIANFQNPETSKAVETLYYNSRLLKQKYQNDPRNIAFSGDRTYQDLIETYRKLDEFKQFQNGVGKAALLVKNYVRFNIWNFNPCEIHVKADVHLNRIALANAIEFYRENVQIPASEAGYIRQERIVKVLTPAIFEITRQKRISAVDLDDALWGLGSKLCSLNCHSVCNSFCPIKCEKRPQIDETKSSLNPCLDSRLYRGIQAKTYDPNQTVFDFYS